MNPAIPYLIIAAVLFTGCDVLLPGEQRPGKRPLDYEEISMAPMHSVSAGGALEEVIRSEAEYEELIYKKFQEPLNSYCNEHFDEERSRIESRYPDLPEEEIQDKLNKSCIEQTPMFSGELIDPEFPEIDFSDHTLLGQAVHASGCREPEHEISLTLEDSICRYSVITTQFGSCEMFITGYLWILTEPIPEKTEVVFEHELLTETTW